MATRSIAKHGLRPDLLGAVIDRWWPYRVGTVIRRLKTRLHVQWSDGEIWRYDAAHARFLAPLVGTSPPVSRATRREPRAPGCETTQACRPRTCAAGSSARGLLLGEA